jgi:hypothetical protein
MQISDPDLVELVVRLAVGAIATFGAILLWARTRDAAWMLVIIGTIIRYGEIMYTTFTLFGILSDGKLLFGLPLVRILLTNLPPLFYFFGFVAALSKTRLK